MSSTISRLVAIRDNVTERPTFFGCTQFRDDRFGHARFQHAAVAENLDDCHISEFAKNSTNFLGLAFGDAWLMPFCSSWPSRGLSFRRANLSSSVRDGANYRPYYSHCLTLPPFDDFRCADWFLLCDITDHGIMGWNSYLPDSRIGLVMRIFFGLHASFRPC